MNERVMSRSQAAYELLELAKGGGLSRAQVEAIQLGCRALVKRHFDCVKNRAVRQARKQQAETSPHETKEN